jgi:hypothetical protein
MGSAAKTGAALNNKRTIRFFIISRLSYNPAGNFRNLFHKIQFAVENLHPGITTTTEDRSPVVYAIVTFSHYF